ncbi:hypothetical protein A5906_25780 [Bradyrhizobium sacchari]|uniref:Uncharacterized protein n=1 Tax=Bradyrhizobium sacchari TaxID=1399419 RepID=A0A560JZ58_9BRAD|nr:hypothetical protein [Bradyrhizobium sacchari]OPY99152.1 hypothetical protein A5906_25780 [Bradyrhizobium sacchari]TWB63051.1 hypothetical protein FBZ94_103751 [Bradyrhizobium sacchari]TWB76019.1 hypothetical protein FBZ95_104199 [Bradyrhizobium sacchari]
MLRPSFLGLLIVLAVGVLSAVELRAPPRFPVAIVQSPAAPDAGSSASPDTLAKGDRLDVAPVSSVTPTEVALAEAPVAPPNDARITSPEPSRPTARQRHNSKTAAGAARPKPKRVTDIKQTAVAERPKLASETAFCRLAAFGGLRKALNLSGCEI